MKIETKEKQNISRDHLQILTIFSGEQLEELGDRLLILYQSRNQMIHEQGVIKEKLFAGYLDSIFQPYEKSINERDQSFDMYSCRR